MIIKCSDEEYSGICDAVCEKIAIIETILENDYFFPLLSRPDVKPDMDDLRSELTLLSGLREKMNIRYI